MPTLIADATEALIARLVRHGIPEAHQRLQVAWSLPPAIPLPTLEELGAPDGPDISDDEKEAWLEADAARLAAAWRK